MTCSALKRTLVLLALVASFSLTGCGLFCDEESVSSFLAATSVCDGADPEGEVVEATAASCQAAGGEWLGSGECYCPYRGS